METSTFMVQMGEQQLEHEETEEITMAQGLARKHQQQLLVDAQQVIAGEVAGEVADLATMARVLKHLIEILLWIWRRWPNLE
jgi:preprotein translocase subunit SecF